MGRIIKGTVTSDRGDKTIVISVSQRKTHSLYKKQYSIRTKFMAHDPENKARVGDLVAIKETRPISARKHFILLEIVQPAGIRFEESDATADIAQEEKS